MTKTSVSKLPWYDAAADLWRSRYLQQLGGEITTQLRDEVEELVRTRLSGLQDGTEATYRKAWNRWAAYAVSRGMAVLPVVEVGVLAWMRHDLCYTIKAKNFQPYLSALNKAHAHCQLAQVALGDSVGDSRRSIAKQQAAVYAAETRVRLPVEVASQVLDAALRLEIGEQVTAAVRLLRASVAVCVDASCGSRGNTGVHIRSGDVQLIGAGGGHVVRLRSLKGEVMVDELTGDEKTLIFPAGAVAGLSELIQKWEECRQVLGVVAEGKQAGGARDSWYRLPGEDSTWNWSTDTMNMFLSEVLQALAIVAPDSFTYSWHSLRHMAASSQSAIGVVDSKIMYLQNWKSMRVALQTYIDPLCPATADCYRWYGWLLPPSRADAEAAAAGRAKAVFDLSVV